MENEEKKYSVIEEWSYPSGKGCRCVGQYTTLDDAHASLATSSYGAYLKWFENTNLDPLRPHRLSDADGFIVTSKNGLDDWYYKVVTCDIVGQVSERGC